MAERLSKAQRKKAKEKQGYTDYFEGLLRRANELEAKHGEHLTKEGVALLRHAKFSFVRDLRGLGAGKLVHEILHPEEIK